MKDKTLICFDVDDTLTDSKTHQVPASTKTALKALKAAGYQLCIATGRNIASLVESGFTDLTQWDGFVCDNGISILDGNQNIIQQSVYSKEVLQRCFDIAKQHDIPIVFQNDKQGIIGEINEHVITAHEFFHQDLPVPMDYDNEPVLMLTVYGPRDFDYHMFKDIPGVKLTFSQSTYADLIQEGINKYESIKTLMKHLGSKQYIAFGDSANDLEMLMHADTSILMGQGDQSLAKHVDFITKPIDEDGIAYAVETLHLLD